MIETVVCELGGLLATGVSTWCLKRKQFGSGRSTISKFPQHLGVNLQQLVGMHNANMTLHGHLCLVVAFVAHAPCSHSWS